MIQINPFVIEGYLAPQYFCDRTEDTNMLTRHLTNQCNVALIAPRRLGKSGLIYHCFNQEIIKQQYHCIYIDIYDTKDLNEFVYALGKGVLDAVKTKGAKVWRAFLSALLSLKSTITFDSEGKPEWSVTLGDIKQPDITLDEIFTYLQQADKPCLIAIDEFQVVATYPEKTIEATLRKRIQQCHNANFVFAGSKRHMMAQMFASEARPFYHSSTIMGLEPINKQTYMQFANHHLKTINKEITTKAFDLIYNTFDGTTWYIQYVLNMLYSSNTPNHLLNTDDANLIINNIVSQHRFAYQALLFQLTTKQKQLLYAIAREGKASAIMSQKFLHKYNMGASTVQGALKTLLDKDFVTQNENIYQLSDKFLELYIKRQLN